MMPLDVADHFRGTVSVWATVTGADGSRQTTFDDSTPVHQQLIDIKYSKDTRKQFKPGLPYKGTVRAAPSHTLSGGTLDLHRPYWFIFGGFLGLKFGQDGLATVVKLMDYLYSSWLNHRSLLKLGMKVFSILVCHRTLSSNPM